MAGADAGSRAGLPALPGLLQQGPRVNVDVFRVAKLQMLRMAPAASSMISSQRGEGSPCLSATHRTSAAVAPRRRFSGSLAQAEGFLRAKAIWLLVSRVSP
jgi:hypothetical protein